MIFFDMNALVLFTSIGIDPQLCGRLCLMLAHSVWQVGLLALMATLIIRFQRRANPELGYAVYVAALLVGLAALPITYSLVELEPQVVEVSRTSASDTPVNMPIVQRQVEQTAQPTLPIAVVRSGPSTSAEPVAISNESQAESFLLRFAPWLAGCYAVGVVVMLLRLGQGIWKSYKLARDAKPVGDGLLNQSFQRIARVWALRVTPVLAQAQEIIVPQVVGLLRPTILLPTSALSGLSPEELEMILAHELAHVRRYDMWINLLQRLAEAILFFNPALWYLSRRVSTYREYCCDEQTCRVKHDEAVIMRLRYAQALLHVVELSGKGTQHAEIAALAATGAGPSELRRRVARLFGEPLREPIGLSRNAILSVVAGLILVIAGPATWQNAAEPQPETASVSEEKPTKTKVEVVAIGTHDEEPQQWWSADGKILEDVPFTWKTSEIVKSDDKVWRRVVVRVETPQGNGQHTDITWQIVGSRAAGDGNIEFKEGFEPGVYLTRYFGLEKGKETFDVRVGITTGSWTKVAESNGMGSSSHGLVDKKSVLFSAPMANGDGTSIVVSHNFFDRACRVVAIDHGGKVHDSGGRGGASAGEIYQSPATFRGLALDQIDHFEFQTRDYEWTEIKDLPVEPREKVAEAVNETREMLLKVVDSDGKRIRGAKVFRNHRYARDGASKNEIENENYITDEKGEAIVSLSGKSVDLRLWVSKPGYVPLHAMWAKEFQTDGDKIPGSFEFRMNRGTKIGGVVTNVAGIPIPDVKVKVVDAVAEQFHIVATVSKPGRRPLRDQYLSEGAEVVTDSEGKWSLNNIPTDGELVLSEKNQKDGEKTPLLLKFSHPDYQTIEGIDDWRTVTSPPLEMLRDGTARTVMTWVDKDDPARVNAIRLDPGERYSNADFSGKRFKSQRLMVWGSDFLAGAKLVDSTWEDMELPAVSGLLNHGDLTRAKLINMRLHSQSSGMQAARFDGAILESADLRGGVSAFQETTFDEASITNSYLEGGGSAFQMSSFQNAKLNSSKLKGEGSAFQKANFNGAKWLRTTIVCNSPTAFQGASLNDTEFTEADLSSIDAEALRSCEFDAKTPPRYDATTKFPEGFDPQAAGWKLLEEASQER